MSSFADPIYNPQLLDIAEQLRRRDLLQQMPNYTAVPPSMQTPVQAPQQQQDPYQMAAQATQQMQQSAAQSQPILQDVRKQLGQVQPPSQAAYQKAAQAYSGLGPEPDPTQYHRNKLLMALTAPLMAKGFLANPQATMRNLDFLTRPGYGAAEQQYQRTLAQRERDFKVQSDILNQSNKAFAETLSGARSRIDAEQAIDTFNAGLARYPMDMQLLAAQIAEVTQRAVREKSPIPQPNALSSITYRDADGKRQITNGYPSINPDGSVDWKGPEGDTIHDVMRVDKLPPESMAPFAIAYQTEMSKFAQDHPGESPNPADLQKIMQQAMHDSRDVNFENQQKMLLEREKHSDLMLAKRDATSPLRSRQSALNAQVEALKEGLKTLDLGYTNTVSDNLQALLAVKSSLAGSGSRVAQVEIGLVGGGKFQKLAGFIREFNPYDPKQAGKFTPEILNQMKEYETTLLNEAVRINRLNDEYIQRIDRVGPDNIDDIQKLQDAYMNWVVNPEQMKQQEPIQVRRGPDGKLLPPGKQ